MFSQLLKNLKNLRMLKTVAALALAGTVALSASACSFNKNTGSTEDPTTTITDPIIDDPTTDDPTTDDPGDTDTTEEHSEIYNTIKNGTYYADLVINAINDYNASATLSYVPNSSNYQNVAPNSFGFLEKEGCDTSQIKSGNWSCFSYPYFMEGDTNHLYIACNAQTTSSSYYTCYVLKYKLTDLEYSDFIDLCSELVVEQNFFVQELSNQKTPTIESQACMLNSTYDRILNYISDGTTNSTAIYTSNELFGTTSLAMSVLGFSSDDDLLQLAVMTDRANVVSGVKSGQIRYATVRSGAYYQELGDTPISSTTYDGVEVCNFAYKSVIFKTDEDAEY